MPLRNENECITVNASAPGFKYTGKTTSFPAPSLAEFLGGVSKLVEERMKWSQLLTNQPHLFLKLIEVDRIYCIFDLSDPILSHLPNQKDFIWHLCLFTFS